MQLSHTFFGGGPEVLDYRRVVNLVRWTESEGSQIIQVSEWFCSYLTEQNETILRKLLKLCTGFNDHALFDEQFISICFSPSEVLPRASACTFNLFLPLNCSGEEEFKQMMNIRSSRPEVFYEKSVLRNFSKFPRNHLCQSLFFNKVAKDIEDYLEAYTVKKYYLEQTY